MAKILHVITGLSNGGAEAVLSRLATADSNNLHQIVSLTDMGTHGAQLVAGGIPVHTLDMPRGRLSFAGLIKLFQLVRDIHPDVIQTWMYHADLIGGIVARLAGARAIVWGVRNGYPNSPSNVLSTRVVVRLCALVSRAVPQGIVSCSAAGARAHIALGYDSSKMAVIPNGYDTTRLKPDPEAGRLKRASWGIGPDTFLIGMVARWDPHKDHATLIASLAQLQSSMPGDWRCVLVGPAMTEDNEPLVRLLDTHGTRERVLLLGPIEDIVGVMNALDLHVLSSEAEAFPNVVAEAMACGTACVATDVGDAAMIVGSTGWIVPPRAPEQLAECIRVAAVELADPSKRRQRETSARERVVGQFGLDLMMKGYNGVWSRIVDGALLSQPSE